MDGSCSMQASLYTSAPLNLRHKPCRNERAILLPIYGTIYTCAGPAVYRGKVRSRMLRLPEGGLHYTEHVLLILWWRSIIGGFSADARFGGGQITGSPAATCGVGGFALCVFQDVNQKGGEQLCCLDRGLFGMNVWGAVSIWGWWVGIKLMGREMACARKKGRQGEVING